MLTFWGGRQQSCDGFNRRNFLQIGAFGAGLTLADMLRARAATQANRTPLPDRQKSVIMVYLPGGPAHTDTYDQRVQDYSQVSGHVTRSPSAAMTTAPASPVVIGTEGDGGSEGGGDGGSSGESGCDGGDGEPPITAGPAASDDQPSFLLLLLLLLYVCCDSSFRLVLYLPVQTALAVYRCVPSMPAFWLAFRYLLPTRLRREMWMPHVWSMFRDRHRARGLPLPGRITVGCMLWLSTLVLVLRIVGKAFMSLWDWKEELLNAG